MASNKDKLLESAQRFVLKGQIDRAIRDYQQVVALEPKEIRYRQRLAELLVRVGRKSEAITQYEDIGRHYADNSYFLKAIAVYKQIQRLAPGDRDVLLTLASLNHKQGLTGNALAEYGQVVGILEAEGNLKEAVQVLEQMIQIDGDNLSTRLKYATLLRSTGAEDASYQVYRDITELLRARGDEPSLQRLQVQMRQMFPERELPTVDLVTRMMAQGDLGGAVAALHQMLQRDNSGLKLWRLLCEAKSRQGDVAGVRLTYHQMMRVFPDDLSLMQETISCALETDAAEEGIELLHRHLDRFLAAGMGEEARQLLGRVPDPFAADPRVKEGLRRLGGEAPQPDPFSSSEMQIDLPHELLEELELADPFGEEASSAAGELASFPGQEKGALSPWEVEIDLDLDTEPELVLSAPPPQETRTFAPSLDFGASVFGEVSAPASLEGDAVVQPEEAALELTLTDAAEELTLTWDEAPWQLEEADPDPSAPAFSPGKGRGACWEELFPEWGAPMLGIVEPEELESHYDLGIAYREMGLYADAVREFQVAAGNPRRRIDCLALQALCHRDQGETGKARDLLEKGLSLEEVSGEERVGLTYELAYLYEKQGEIEEALRLYDEVYAQNSSFHDVAHKIACLAGMDELLDVIDLVLVEDEEKTTNC